MIEVVGIFIAAGDGQHARAQDVGKRVNNPRRVAPIGDLRSKLVGDPHAPLRQGQQHHAAVRSDAPAIERGGDLLAVDRWQRERQQAIVDHGGCGREVWSDVRDGGGPLDVGDQASASKRAAGVDGQSIEEFEARLGDNLYKLWNWLSSGSYYAATRAASRHPEKRWRDAPAGHSDVAGIMHLMQLVFGVTGDARS